MSDLKLCPCCGHRAELAEERFDYGIVWTIECFWCGLMIERLDRQKAINAWNSRRTDGVIAWLDAEIKKREESMWFNVRSQASTLRDCKKQILKLLELGRGLVE